MKSSWRSHQLYYSRLATLKQIDVQQAQIAAGEQILREAHDSVQAGDALEVTVIGAHADLLRNRQLLLAAENQLSDLTEEMNDALGLPLDTDLVLAAVDLSPRVPLSREQYLAAALAKNPEVQVARETLSKAQSGVRAARDEYIPDIGVFARDTYQSGVRLSHTVLEPSDSR